MFAADGTMSAMDLPPTAFNDESPQSVQRLSGKGRWRITSPLGGDPDQRNIVELSFDELTGKRGYTTQLSASRPDDTIILTLRNFAYTKK